MEVKEPAEKYETSLAILGFSQKKKNLIFIRMRQLYANNSNFQMK